jgi:transposase
LDRTRPVLALCPGVPERQTHDYIRHGTIERATVADEAIHVILDNLSTHKSPPVRRWLRRHPRVHFHFIPTSSSWLNLVERWFGEITRTRIRRGTFESVPALIVAIEEYLSNYNQAPRRFIWTKDADMILDKIAKCPKASNA